MALNMQIKEFVQKNIWTLTVAGFFLWLAMSAVSGAVAGMLVAQKMVPGLVSHQPSFRIPSTSSTVAVDEDVNTPTTTQIRLVPLQMEDFTLRAIPESIFNRRSPVGVVYARKKTAVSQNFLAEDEQLGRAVALTSDGWFVTTRLILENAKMNDLLIWHAGRAYQVEKGILDKSTNAVFLKTNARDLSVTAFADYWSGRTGLAAWLEPSAEQFAPSSIIAIRHIFHSEPVSSDKPERRIVAMGDLKLMELGSPLWDAKGALIGLVESSVDGRLLILPGSSLSSSLQSVMVGGTVERANLGVFAMDLALARLISEQVEDFPNRGAWLREDKKLGRSVVKDSAADRAGLKTGDVILQVDRDILDGSLDLSDVIMQYRAGSTVNLRVWRAGEELEVPVTLGSQTTSESLL